MTVAEYLSSGTTDIKKLLCHALSVNSSWLYTHSEVMLSEKQTTLLERAIAKRNTGVPLAYITGTKGFYHLEFEVNEHTLIPRPETEQIIDIVQYLSLTQARIIDLGTGSGAIALTIKSLFPHYHVSACDKSTKALEVAKRNMATHQLDVTFFESDWFVDTDSTYDMIISNPPYIHHTSEYLKELTHEPQTALVSEHEGLKDIQHIITHAPTYLNKGGYLLLEHGFDQREAIVELLVEFSEVQVFDDLNGVARNILAKL